MEISSIAAQRAYEAVCGWSSVRRRDQTGSRGDATEDVGGPAEDAPRDVDADREERHQLDDGLDRHRGHQAGLLLGEVEVARAEEDAEERQRHGHEQGRVEDVEHRSLVQDHA